MKNSCSSLVFTDMSLSKTAVTAVYCTGRHIHRKVKVVFPSISTQTKHFMKDFSKKCAAHFMKLWQFFFEYYLPVLQKYLLCTKTLFFTASPPIVVGRIKKYRPVIMHALAAHQTPNECQQQEFHARLRHFRNTDDYYSGCQLFYLM
jgi:hypothetical protein